jgi:hypothetical protein
MFCSNCANPLEMDATFCTSCGTSVGAVSSPADRALARARTTTQDAQFAIQFLMKDPFGSLRENYASLGEARARSAAFGLLALDLLVFAFAVYRNVPQIVLFITGGSEIKLILGTLFVGALCAAVVTAARFLARLTFKAAGDLTADMFVAGVALFFLALSALILGLFTLASDVGRILAAASYCVTYPFALLFLYESNLQLANVPKYKSAWMVSVTLLYAIVSIAVLGSLAVQMAK